MLSEERTKFDYLFNAVMYAAQEPNPAKHDYRGKTLAMFAYVRDLEAKVRLLSGAGEDAKRLDFLDACNLRLNQHYGTNYGWKVVLSPNVTRLMTTRRPADSGYVADVDVHDSQAHGPNSVRAAIDAALSTIEGQEGSSAIRSGTIRKE
jgi:hypothetical protein